MSEPRHAARDLVLDTNAVVHLFRKSPLGHALRSIYGLASREWRPILSAVTVGELHSLALQWNWDATRVAQLDELLLAFPVIDVYADSASLCDAYAEIDCAARRVGAKMGKNDLWIAATAKIRGGVVVTADRDFDAPGSAGLVSVDVFDPAGALVASW